MISTTMTSTMLPMMPHLMSFLRRASCFAGVVPIASDILPAVLMFSLGSFVMSPEISRV